MHGRLGLGEYRSTEARVDPDRFPMTRTRRPDLEWLRVPWASGMSKGLRFARERGAGIGTATKVRKNTAAPNLMRVRTDLRSLACFDQIASVHDHVAFRWNEGPS